ncbi:MAG: putative selenate reductase subunit YgfK [Bacteroidales bacterium]|nr:putative selenate reductase subunit YgfK [Bacteroidales bacterium]
MSDKFFPLAITHLLELIFKNMDTGNGIFGIPAELFFKPEHHKFLRQKQFGKTMDTPFGVAAGPHSQLAQNIIAAWLTGASYIELKTVQTLDELEVSKPCIDMQDEGYNCEWSQELKIRQSFDEYLNAWIIIHVLNHYLNRADDPGVIFNMSVGYDLKGIMQDNVRWFFEKMNDCSEELHQKISEIRPIYPEIDQISIPSRISDNITLSTMHGCPADEIESITRYLLEEKKLHTLVKLNPTLLGPQQLKHILNDTLNFTTQVPLQAFEHDLKYDDAIGIITSLQKTARDHQLTFGLKLTNTLESENIKAVFGDDVDMMYMSGRALHPLSVVLADKLQRDFDGHLQLSFSAGADAFNLPALMAAGFSTVTVCTDILKPGGYMRLAQYVEQLQQAMEQHKAENFDQLICQTAGDKNRRAAASENLRNYAAAVLKNKKYQRDYIVPPDIKTGRKLDFFDCISAPCRDTCATAQDIPEYMYYTAGKQFSKAFEVILRTNPFPSITGMVCDHLCQNKCTRVHYDESLLIREVKRFIGEQPEQRLAAAKPNGLKTAIIGAGPAGLSCAYYLALAGFYIEVFEEKAKEGGMVEYAIPGFRLTPEAIQRDFRRITDLGVQIHYNTRVNDTLFKKLQKDFDYVFAGPGAQLSAPLNIEGKDAEGVLDSLDFLFKARQGEPAGLGRNVVIIGGGNTAMDAARTAFRLVGEEGTVTVVYRRRIREMPADQGEIKAVLDEGMQIIELCGPEKVITKNNKVTGLLCSRMELAGTDSSGRPKPQKIKGSAFEIPCDTIIPAVGQAFDIDFADKDLLEADTVTYETKINKVFTGGDALRGASTAINAIGDGRKAAASIMKKADKDHNIPKPENGKKHSYRELILKRGKRVFAPEQPMLPVHDRKNFKLVQATLDENSAVQEAQRCLYCDEICSICTTVCPNFANYAYEVEPCVIKMQKAVRQKDNSLVLEDDDVFEIKQRIQILNIANFCNECGNCNTFCPTSSAPYKDKPRLHLTLESFRTDEEGGYYLAELPDRKNLIFKHKGTIKTLSETEDAFIYETDFVKARFRKEVFALEEVQLLTPCVNMAAFHEAAIMRTILEGAGQLVFG